MDRSTNTSEQSSASRADRRMLTAVKVLLVLILVGFGVVGDDDTTWPLVTWPMFQASGSRTPKTTTSLRVRAVDSSGQSHDFTPLTLSDVLSRDAVEQVIETTFDNDLAPSQKQQAQVRLADMTQSQLPGIDIVEIQGWRMTWEINLDLPQGIDLNTPDKQTLLGLFRLADLKVMR